jgi:adenylate cyclase class 2
MQVLQSSTSHHCDEYFNHCLLDFAAQDIALRVRSTQQRHVLTYKGPNLDHRAKVREELELEFDDEQRMKFRNMLFGMGFHSVAVVNKKRDSVTIMFEPSEPINDVADAGDLTPNANGTAAEITVCLDEVQGVGTFVELEIVVAEKSNVETAKQILQSLALTLNITTEPTTVSYLEMLIQSDSSANTPGVQSDVGQG